MTDIPAAAGPARPHDAAGRRLRSLDLLRGLTVLGMILVNATAGVRRLDGPVFPLLLHAKWAGFTFADAVFPAFIVMVGISIAISSRPDRAAPVGAILGRAARLILLGLVLTNLFALYDWDQYGPPRMAGVLQRIGIAYAAAALMYPRMGMKARGIAAGTILLLYWPLCWIPSPDGLPTDLWKPGHNFVSWADRALFGGWRFKPGPEGFDPEGALSTFPVIAQALIGTIVGDWLRRGDPVRATSRRLAFVGAGMLIAGLLWGFVFPIAKNFWSSSFVLVSSGITLLLLAGFHLRYDKGDPPIRPGGLLGSFGRNAIAAYTLHEITAFILSGDIFQLPAQWLRPIVGTQVSALAPVLLFTALVWWPIAYMDRRGWYLKV
jgi:predicted acyltransferase